jgi:hypothetical protein
MYEKLDGRLSNAQPRSEASKTNRSPFVDAIAIPKGGSAIKGIGEKFDTNPVTGTASFRFRLEPLQVDLARG